MVLVIKTSFGFAVEAPTSRKFSIGAKRRIGGYRFGPHKLWMFDKAVEVEVRALIARCFGDTVVRDLTADEYVKLKDQQ